MSNHGQAAPVLICAYCGCENPETRDHVVPRSLCPSSKRADWEPITVPSCSECNKCYSRDEEEFRLFVVSMKRRTLEADELRLGKVMRGLQRPENERMLHDFLSRFHYIDVRSKGGIYLSKEVGIKFSEGFFRVLEKIARGLHYYRTGHVVARRCRAKFRDFDLEEQLPFVAMLQKFGAYGECDPNIFEYLCVIPSDPESGVSWWVMSFFHGAPMVVFLETLDDTSAPPPSRTPPTA